MIEDAAQTQSCLLAVDAGGWRALTQYQLKVLLTAGLIQRFDVILKEPLASPAQPVEYRLTQAGRDTLWPPEK